MSGSAWEILAEVTRKFASLRTMFLIFNSLENLTDIVQSRRSLLDELQERAVELHLLYLEDRFASRVRYVEIDASTLGPTGPYPIDLVLNNSSPSDGMIGWHRYSPFGNYQKLSLSDSNPRDTHNGT